MGQWDIQWPASHERNREGNEGRVKAGAAGAKWRVHTDLLRPPAPPNFTAMGMTEREAFPTPAWEGRQGVDAAPASRATLVPLSSAENAFLQWVVTSNVDSFFLKTQTSVHPEAPPGTLIVGNPPLPAPSALIMPFPHLTRVCHCPPPLSCCTAPNPSPSVKPKHQPGNLHHRTPQGPQPLTATLD